MKRMWLWIMLICIGIWWLPGQVEAASQLPVRQVVILQTLTEPGQEDLGQRIRQRVIEPFRYPYYELHTAAPEAGPITRLRLEKIANRSGADIVIAPELAHWNQFSYTIYRRFDGDLVEYVRTGCIIRLYYYERGDNSLRKVEKRYFDTAEWSSQTSARVIIDEVMNQVMKELPYRRIPTDISHPLLANG